jgi:hypothetical protein
MAYPRTASLIRVKRGDAPGRAGKAIRGPGNCWNNRGSGEVRWTDRDPGKSRLRGGGQRCFALKSGRLPPELAAGLSSIHSYEFIHMNASDEHNHMLYRSVILNQESNYIYNVSNASKNIYAGFRIII